jgi:predicted DNA-binding protein
MATTQKRLNITLSAESESLVYELAARDKVPAATKVRQLLEESLALVEDQVLSDMAEERLASTTKNKLTHDAVWD